MSWPVSAQCYEFRASSAGCPYQFEAMFTGCPDLIYKARRNKVGISLTRVWIWKFRLCDAEAEEVLSTKCFHRASSVAHQKRSWIRARGELAQNRIFSQRYDSKGCRRNNLTALI